MEYKMSDASDETPAPMIEARGIQKYF